MRWVFQYEDASLKTRSFEKGSARDVSGILVGVTGRDGNSCYHTKSLGFWGIWGLGFGLASIWCVSHGPVDVWAASTLLHTVLCMTLARLLGTGVKS